MRAFAVLSAIVQVVSAVASSQHALDPIVLDDSDASFYGTQMFNATYFPCLKDAYGNGYHQGARASSMANYTFEPEVDGCYKIEEWHAGQDQTCSKHLSQGVHLQVNYCKGGKAYTMLDQSQNGGQWNTVGALPFYKGWTGHFILGGEGKNQAGHECRAGTCFWASDAFRLTWISNASGPCRIPPEEPASTTTITTTKIMMTSQGHWEDHHYVVTEAESLAQHVVAEAESLAESAWQLYAAGSRSNRQDFSCGRQGWMQNFLYLDPKAGENMEVPATFKFDPPEDGCYLVEEFRPANTCSQKFSKETQLTIQYCKNQTLRVMLDQTEYGNQWNTVALLPFYVGHQGKVEVRHPQVGDELAVADAFRFTRVSASCHAAPLKLVEYARLKQHPVSITLDDKDAEKTGSSQNEVPYCDKKALEGKAYAVAHDTASAKFMFMPPSTGCYRVDEFHPATSEDCSLAKFAGIEINYCLGARATGSVKLDQNGDQWNTLGHFPFYAGVLGNVTSHRLAASPGIWAADGFRFTKVSDSCAERPYSALVTLHITGVDLRAHELPDGQLTTHADLRLAFHHAMVVATGLDHKAVRLIGLRSGSIIVEFELAGEIKAVSMAVERTKAQLVGEAPLRRSLCEAAGVGDLQACNVEFQRSTAVPAPEADDEQEESRFLPLVIGVSSGVMLLAGLVAMMLVLRHRRRLQGPKFLAEVKDVPELSDTVMEWKAEKDVKDNVSDSGSTATPKEMQDVEVMSLSEHSAVMSCFEDQLSIEACSIHTPTHSAPEALA
mmetsp:Transcript_44519/g.83493  ORF Transcript_44519/g.83493 Transcript_44519/m.83493 type:complete len:779 (-) Transcript_44519:197-2533(-)